MILHINVGLLRTALMLNRSSCSRAVHLCSQIVVLIWGQEGAAARKQRPFCRNAPMLLWYMDGK